MDNSDSGSGCFIEISKHSTSKEIVPVSNILEYGYDETYYAPSTESEQILVNKFLDGELNFSEYIENIEQFSDNVDEPNVSQPFLHNPAAHSPNQKDKSIVPLVRDHKPPKKLPPALKGLMGEANLRYARGDKETAAKICLEIIRQVPTAPEPFLTLASVYDEMGDQEKFLQMSLLAAHLSSNDAYEWIHLGELSENLGLIKQAVTCYSKAVNIDLLNFDIHKKRAALLEKLGDKKTAIRGYIKMLTSLKPEQGEQILSLSKFLAELCHKENDIVKASSVLDVAFEKCPQLITVDFTHLQLELLIHLKQYRQCIELMVNFCGLEITSKDSHITSCEISADTPVDIIAKLVIVLIHLKYDNFFLKFLNIITNLNPSEAGDLYLDIIDALVEEHYLIEADKLLSSLLSCESYRLPGVWLKHAENLKSLNHLEDSAKSFYKVLEQAPQHIEARLALGTILVELDRPDEAILALTQNESDYLDPSLLIERCLLLKKQMSRAQELIMVGQVLFSRHFTHIRNKDELSAISIIQRYDKKRYAVKQVRKAKKESEEECNARSFKEEILGSTREEEWELFKDICNVCLGNKLFNAFQRFTFSAQLSTMFHIYKYEIDILSVIASFLNKDSYNGYNIVRTLVVKDLGNIHLWHLFNLIVTKSDDSRHHRFIMRQLAQNSDHYALALLHGNNCLVSGTYKYAMHEYSSAYVKNPTPLGALLLGLTYLQMAAQKFTSKKHQLVVQALALITEYKDLRGPEALQEVHYNLGRGFHHLGIFNQAIFHYKKAIDFRNVGLSKDRPLLFDLTKEAAFNLHLIYLQSESHDLGQMYLEKYIIV